MLLNDYNKNDKDIFDSLFDLGKGLWNVGKKGYKKADSMIEKRAMENARKNGTSFKTEKRKLQGKIIGAGLLGGLFGGMF